MKVHKLTTSEIVRIIRKVDGYHNEREQSDHDLAIEVEKYIQVDILAGIPEENRF